MEGEKKQRTPAQNRAIHKLFEMVAEALNKDGHCIEVQVGSRTVKRLWTKYFVKELIWRPIQRAEFKTLSTTELLTIEPSIVYDHINAFISGEFGIYVPFPSLETVAE